MLTINNLLYAISCTINARRHRLQYFLDNGIAYERWLQLELLLTLRLQSSEWKKLKEDKLRKGESRSELKILAEQPYSNNNESHERSDIEIRRTFFKKSAVPNGAPQEEISRSLSLHIELKTGHKLPDHEKEDTEADADIDEQKLAKAQARALYRDSCKMKNHEASGWAIIITPLMLNKFIESYHYHVNRYIWTRYSINLKDDIGVYIIESNIT